MSIATRFVGEVPDVCALVFSAAYGRDSRPDVEVEATPTPVLEPGSGGSAAGDGSPKD